MHLYTKNCMVKKISFANTSLKLIDFTQYWKHVFYINGELSFFSNLIAVLAYHLSYHFNWLQIQLLYFSPGEGAFCSSGVGDSIDIRKGKIFTFNILPNTNSQTFRWRQFDAPRRIPPSPATLLIHTCTWI